VGTWGTAGGEQRISWCHLALVKGVLYVKNKKRKKTSVAADITKQAFFPPFPFSQNSGIWVIEFGVVAVCDG
jgi:hypothetical protein